MALADSTSVTAGACDVAVVVSEQQQIAAPPARQSKAPPSYDEATGGKYLPSIAVISAGAPLLTCNRSLAASAGFGGVLPLPPSAAMATDTAGFNRSALPPSSAASTATTDYDLSALQPSISTSTVTTDFGLPSLLASDIQPMNFEPYMTHQTQTDASADALFDDVFAHMQTQTSDDFWSELCLSDNHTQTADTSLASDELEATTSSSVETQTARGETQHNSVQIQVSWHKCGCI